MSGAIGQAVCTLGLRAAQSPAMPRQLHCSFCGRSADAVDRLVGGASAHICDSCIAKCVAVLEDHGGMPAAPTLQ